MVKQMVSTNDYTWKLIVGGMGGVGKTTFLHRYIHDKFISDTKLTVGCQFHSTVVNRHGKQIGLIIWDLGGQQRFRFIQDKYIR
ncbi:GTP-binding protein, partial [Candidatus Bathyarchaeota archaeon]|nr:GTP-binding protein [Candidatus Bathyarchaeota archaeon]